jgi:FkbM family methyltransferase
MVAPKVGGREIMSGFALFPEEDFFVADVGAYCGWYTFIASKLVGPKGHVYSFEPEPTNFLRLSKVILYSDLRNVSPFMIALGDNDGFENLHISDSPSMHSITLERSKRIIKVPSRQLDSLVKAGDVSKLDLIKIDVEGAELKVLRGCRAVIEKFNPIFSIDVNHYDEEFKEINTFMNGVGYEIDPLIGGTGRPYSIVAYPSSKKDLVARLIDKTRKLSFTSDLT